MYPVFPWEMTSSRRPPSTGRPISGCDSSVAIAPRMSISVASAAPGSWATRKSESRSRSSTARRSNASVDIALSLRLRELDRLRLPGLLPSSFLQDVVPDIIVRICDAGALGLGGRGQRGIDEVLPLLVALHLPRDRVDHVSVGRLSDALRQFPDLLL